MTPDLTPRLDPATPGVLWPKERSVTTTDGARIDYTFRGPVGGPVVALSPGFLCPDTWWWHLVPALARAGNRVLIHHPRGIGSSTRPTRLRADSFSVPRIAADLGDVLDAEGIDRLHLIGHSMGVQAALEVYRQTPERIMSLALVTGPDASPLRTLYDARWPVELAYSQIRMAFRLLPDAIGDRLWTAGWRLPALAIGRLAAAYGPRTPKAIVDSYTTHAAALPTATVLAVAEGMQSHSARDLLGSIAVPTLVVQGGKDPFSPPSVGARLAREIPGAVLRVVPNATHGATLEYPEVVNGLVLDHLDRATALDGADASA